MEKNLLKKSDKVIIHSCLEAERYNGKIWTCKTDEFTRGEGVYKQDLIFLEGFSGSFLTECLQKVNVEDHKDLKKALCVMLYDLSSDSGELELNSSDEDYIDNIISVLIQKNDSICPFKNYDCTEHCKENNINCGEYLITNCNRDLEDIWKEFIEKNWKEDV